MKKLLSMLLVLSLMLGLAAFASAEEVLQVAAIETAYGAQMWQDIAAAFTEETGIKVELVTDKNLEDVITASMKGGDYPDVVMLATGRKAALTETMVKENLLTDLTDVLEGKVLGEDVLVKDKIVPGFLDTSVTNPYPDGKTYLAPMFYSPCGLFYNANLLREKGWELPTTFDEMWALGDKAKAEGIALFAYPTAGYFDAFFYALLNEVGGPEFFNKATHYAEGIWDTEEAKLAFDIVTKLASYTEPSVPSNANNDNFFKNQQLILDNKAIFMPNGTWIIGEMADAPRVDGFEWGFMALPAVKEGGDRYSYTFFEQLWVPSEAKNQEAAKQFVSFVYSDKAADIFFKVGGAVQPIVGFSDKLEGDNKLFYSIYDTGAKAAMGAFAATEPVEGVSFNETVFHTVNSLVSGDKTQEDWVNAIKAESDKLRAALK